ncbi:(2Fe-2S)-binding protein [Streptomyces iranensis]|uniref:(2Fe-2S)-binding domain-containing protein n=1 Tax=Streptomyces iranensis TaxID=576784 RepID=A0A060ZJL7_9ACTN|nr:2Fe-2S iron-sulfur cluster-binding protein [Streptomyces iranensis]MBP2068711.1 hypothetical protein [Streptomyces iranensis]CDR01360.1 (2Fe-2S)-binding domain-containing protein [Streptomyces iranensis]
MPTERVPQDQTPAIPEDPSPPLAPTRRTFIAATSAVGGTVVAGGVLGASLLSEPAATAASPAPSSRLGLADGDDLHALQQAFIDEDAFQCGYCAPGQIMSGVACVQEGHTDSPEEIREWMSGNICRCGCYPKVVRAVQQAAGRK